MLYLHFVVLVQGKCISAASVCKLQTLAAEIHFPGKILFIFRSFVFLACFLGFILFEKIIACKKSEQVAKTSVRADLHDTILSHATSSRQAYDMTYDCRSVLKHVLKYYDIFSDEHNNRKSCRGPVVSRYRMRQNRTV